MVLADKNQSSFQSRAQFLTEELEGYERFLSVIWKKNIHLYIVSATAMQIYYTSHNVLQL